MPPIAIVCHRSLISQLSTRSFLSMIKHIDDLTLWSTTMFQLEILVIIDQTHSAFVCACPRSVIYCSMDVVCWFGSYVFLCYKSSVVLCEWFYTRIYSLLIGVRRGFVFWPIVNFYYIGTRRESVQITSSSLYLLFTIDLFVN